MKITGVKTLCLSRPLEPEQQSITARYRAIKADCAIVVIDTDEGLTRIGEACGYGVPWHTRPIPERSPHRVKLVPDSHLVPLPEHVTSKVVALVEPASVANHAVKRARLTRGDRVAVLGVGTVGMLAMQIAKAGGAQVFAIDSGR